MRNLIKKINWKTVAFIIALFAALMIMMSCKKENFVQNTGSVVNVKYNTQWLFAPSMNDTLNVWVQCDYVDIDGKIHSGKQSVSQSESSEFNYKIKAGTEFHFEIKSEVNLGSTNKHKVKVVIMRNLNEQLDIDISDSFAIFNEYEFSKKL